MESIYSWDNEVCKIKYKKVGFFRELKYGEPEGLSLKESISEKPLENEHKILDYLQSGITIAACGGVVYDVICPSRGIIGCPDILTDGVWIWSNDLIYYVREYHVTLDEEFLNYMALIKWKVLEKHKIDLKKFEP